MHKLMLFSGLCLMLLACSESKTDRGLKYMPDMYQSPAYKSQETYVIKRTGADGKEQTVEVPAMRHTPAGTVPRNFISYDFAHDADQGKNLSNPLAATAAVLRLGRDKFNQFCAVCHGKEGDASKGFVATQFQGIPNLNSETVASYADGHIFWIVTGGRGRMPNYRAQLTPEERWSVIHYVRALHTATKNKDLRSLQKGGDSFKPLPEPSPEYDLKNWPEVTK